MENFPIIHLITLVIGAVVLFVIKKKYRDVRIIEMVMVFILYAILVALYTEPVINLTRKLIGLLQ
ncbi:MAG TPA: hypothetical protein ENN23_09195 [Deltaproteobacteria bacterium]|nr:hypothetical protein [Deltaproteobacteria bacterium]